MALISWYFGHCSGNLSLQFRYLRLCVLLESKDGIAMLVEGWYVAACALRYSLKMYVHVIGWKLCFLVR